MNKSKKPNIVFIMSDQHNANTLGCYGNPEVLTPYMDQLAEQGVRFTNAYTQNAICTPSRMSFMTGQYVHNHGYYGLSGPHPGSMPSLLSHLKQNGYRNGIVGKIHTPRNWLSPFCDFVQDAHNFEHEDAHCDYDRYLEEKDLLPLRDDNYIQEWMEKWGESRGQGLDARASLLSHEDTVEGWTAQESVKFIEQSQEDDRPFCLWMSLTRPHETYVPAAKFWDMYDEDKLTLPPNKDNSLADKHPNVQRMREVFRGEQQEWTIYEPHDFESARKRVLRGYYGCVTQVDDTIGQVLQKLDELGLREDTIVIYTSDHGDFAGEHGLIEKAPGISFRAITRIPYIWSWPGHLPAGEVRDSLVEAVDLFPTVCSLAGVPMPRHCDGKDITKVIQTPGVDIRELAVTENVLTKSIQTKKYKLVYFPKEMTEGKDFGELYDTENDPWEMENLYFNEQYSAVVTELKELFLQWLITNTRFVNVLPMKGIDDDHPELDEDGKVGFSVLRKMIEDKATGYI